jgi:hypothetical protein
MPKSWWSLGDKECVIDHIAVCIAAITELEYDFETL